MTRRRRTYDGTERDGLRPRQRDYLIAGQWQRKEQYAPAEVSLDDYMWTHPSAGGVEASWREHGASLTRQHVREHPGTRPWAWWLYDAPEPARRQISGRAPILGGHEVTHRDCEFGIPIMQDEIDPRPVYESQASYLQRHALLTEAEAKRLTDSDYEPEIVTDSD